MTAEETAKTILTVNFTHGRYDAEPGAAIFGKLGARGLEKNLDAVERTYDGFGLEEEGRVSGLGDEGEGFGAGLTAQPARPPASPLRRT